MKRLVYLVIPILSVFIMVFGISGKVYCEDPFSEGGGATVKGTVTLPAEANGKTCNVTIDDNNVYVDGFVKEVRITCGAGTKVEYEISDVPGGDYIVYSLVRVNSKPMSPPVKGDFQGYYPSGPNATVPDSGTVTFDFPISVLTGKW
jgi:hypothetical protein